MQSTAGSQRATSPRAQLHSKSDLLPTYLLPTSFVVCNLRVAAREGNCPACSDVGHLVNLGPAPTASAASGLSDAELPAEKPSFSAENCQTGQRNIVASPFSFDLHAFRPDILALDKLPPSRRITAMRVAPAQSCNGSSTCTASSMVTDQHDSSNIYVRAWRFVQRRLHLRPRAISCPADMEGRATDQKKSEPVAISSSFCADWQRVHLLKELEEAGARAQWRRQQQHLAYEAKQECILETTEWSPRQQHTRSPYRTQAQRKAAQATCSNCGLLFFRPLAVAPDPSSYCSRDCQSTFEYLRDLQEIVDDGAFQSPVSWTSSDV